MQLSSCPQVYLTSRKHWFDWLPSLLLLAALGISLAVSDEEAAIEARLEEFVQVISQPCGKLRGGVDEEATIETVGCPPSRISKRVLLLSLNM